MQSIVSRCSGEVSAAPQDDFMRYLPPLNQLKLFNNTNDLGSIFRVINQLNYFL